MDTIENKVQKLKELSKTQKKVSEIAKDMLDILGSADLEERKQIAEKMSNIEYENMEHAKNLHFIVPRLVKETFEHEGPKGSFVPPKKIEPVEPVIEEIEEIEEEPVKKKRSFKMHRPKKSKKKNEEKPESEVLEGTETKDSRFKKLRESTKNIKIKLPKRTKKMKKKEKIKKVKEDIQVVEAETSAIDAEIEKAKSNLTSYDTEEAKLQAQLKEDENQENNVVLDNKHPADGIIYDIEENRNPTEEQVGLSYSGMSVFFLPIPTNEGAFHDSDTRLTKYQRGKAYYVVESLGNDEAEFTMINDPEAIKNMMYFPSVHLETSCDIQGNRKNGNTILTPKSIKVLKKGKLKKEDGIRKIIEPIKMERIR